MRQRAATVILSLSLVLGACAPGIDGITGNIADRAVDRALSTAIDSAVDRIVNEAVNLVVATVVNRALDSVFDSIRFGPDFSLDIFSGSWTANVSGAVNRAYGKVPTAPEEDPADLGLALRGLTDDDLPFYGIYFVKAQDEPEFAMIYAEASEEGEIVRTLVVEIEGVSYQGNASVALTSETATRLVGSLSAPLLTGEDGAGTITVTASFDVPVNPAGSLIVAGVR
ncbi:MAG: hypothetical protein M3498_01850 [Deinococcota bacterium]|jgi:hypothetical protein|nr:hypothetical protein [Deinococcota bacterium]